MTSYLIGVSRSRKWSDLKPGEKLYWCVFKKNHVSPGDIVLLYKPGRGIGQLFEIIAVKNVEDRVDCNSRGMRTISVQLTVNLESPVSFREMKEDPILSKMGAVGRNFQMTTFELELNHWQRLFELIRTKNPDIVRLFES